jgi:hypothetical protein
MGVLGTAGRVFCSAFNPSFDLVRLEGLNKDEEGDGGGGK